MTKTLAKLSEKLRWLDGLISETFFGIKYEPYPENSVARINGVIFQPTKLPNGSISFGPAYFSTNLTNAFTLADHIKLLDQGQEEYGQRSGFVLERDDGKWQIRYRYGLAIARDISLPLAICRAALFTRGLKYDE
jgi:hypothetical protein